MTRSIIGVVSRPLGSALQLFRRELPRRQAIQTTTSVQDDLVDPQSGRRQPLAPGWAYLAWSPDGQWLLVMRDQRRLGLIRLDDPLHVQPLGIFPRPVWAAAWLGPSTSSGGQTPSNSTRHQ